METRGRRLARTVLWLTVAGCGGELTTAPPLEQLRAAEAMEAWVQRHRDGFDAAVTTASAPTRPTWTPSCASPETNGYVSLRLGNARGEVELAFRCPIDEHATVEDLQAHFVRAVPWNLPTGIAVPHWRFQALPPVSSIYDGVTFHVTGGGELAVDVRTTLYALVGSSDRPVCEPVADGPARRGCYLFREHRVPLRMRYTVKADLRALR